MAKQWIKFLLAVLPILILINCGNRQGDENGFRVKVNHTVFLNRKSQWSSVNKLKNSISIEYLPKSNHLIIERETKDTLQNISFSNEEIKVIKKSYGDFRFIGGFYNSNLPLDYSLLMYVNTKNNDVLQISRMTVDEHGREEIVGAMVYMVDSINYAKDFISLK